MVGGPNRLLERSAELASLSAVVRDCRGSALIEGPAGIGKTALMSDALAMVPEEAMVRLARSSSLEQGLSGGVILQLLSGAVDEADGGAFEGAAQGAHALFATTAGPLPEGLALFHALHQLCVNLSRDRPLVLAVDDAQWADRLSLEFLAYLIRRIADLPISVILTKRTGEPRSEPNPWPELGELPEVHRIELEPLRRESATVLVESAFPGRFAQPLIDQWWYQSGGVPLFLLELARSHRHGAENTPPGSVVRLVQSRLDRLPASTREVAVSLSVLGNSATPHEVAALTKMGLSTLLEDLDQLERVELIDVESCSFAHPVLGEAVLASVPSGALARLRIDAARMLHHDAPLRSAAQLAALGDSVHTGEQWAAGTLYAASRNALARGAATEASGYLRRALQEPADDKQRYRILLELGKLAAQRRDLEALTYFEQAASLAADSRQRSQTALCHAEALFHFGDLDQCAQVSLEAADELGESDRELALELHAMAFNADGVTGSRRDRATPFFEEVAEGRSPGELAVLTHVVADAAARGSWTAAEVRERGLRALAGGVLLTHVGPASPTYIFCGTALAWADEFQAVIELTDAGLELGERQGSRMGVAYASALQAGVQLRSGRLKDAEQSAARVIYELADADPMSYGISVGWLIQSLVEQGRVPEAREALQGSGLAGPLPPLGTVAFLMLARGHLCLAEGDAHAAAQEFTDVGRIAQDSGYPNPAALAWRSGLSSARLALGQDRDALRLAEAEVELARQFGAGRATSIALLSLARCTDGPEQRAAILGDSASEAKRAGARLDEARALVDLGELRIATGDQRAQQTLKESMDLADRCGATALGDLAKAGVLRTGARPHRRRIRGVAALTRQEHRVTALAARGKLNREIADELFVSTGTVETHLTNAFKKLGASSRADLTTMFPPGTPESPPKPHT